MATHIILVNFTKKGISEIKQSPDRATAFAKTATRLGIEVESVHWTSGGFDGVLLMNAPDDQTAAAASLALAHSGFVKTQTLRAFDRTEIAAVLSKL